MKAIPKPLTKKLFSIEMAEKQGLSRSKLSRMVKDGHLERIKRGVYRLPEIDLNDEDTFRAATLTVGSPSAICLLSALTFYHLTDQIPHKTWILVEREKRSIQKGLRLVRVANPQWDIGIERQLGYRITSIDRTLVDCLVGHRYIGKMIGIESLKLALANNKTTLNKIIDMASKLGCLDKIQPILEVLS